MHNWFLYARNVTLVLKIEMQPWPSCMQGKPWKCDTNNIPKCSKNGKEHKTKPAFIACNE